MKHLKIEGKGCGGRLRNSLSLCRSTTTPQRLFPGEQDAPTNFGELTLILVLALALVLMQNFAKVRKSILGWFNGV